MTLEFVEFVPRAVGSGKLNCKKKLRGNFWSRSSPTSPKFVLIYEDPEPYVMRNGSTSTAKSDMMHSGIQLSSK